MAKSDPYKYFPISLGTVRLKIKRRMAWELVSEAVALALALSKEASLEVFPGFLPAVQPLWSESQREQIISVKF